MKSYKQWKILSENYNFNPHIDGQALSPHNISGSEVQIRHLARHLRTSFGLDPSFKDHPQIAKAIELLDQAADIIGHDMSGEDRNRPHQFHGTPNASA